MEKRLRAFRSREGQLESTGLCSRGGKEEKEGDHTCADGGVRKGKMRFLARRAFSRSEEKGEALLEFNTDKKEDTVATYAEKKKEGGMKGSFMKGKRKHHCVVYHSEVNAISISQNKEKKKKRGRSFRRRDTKERKQKGGI